MKQRKRGPRKRPWRNALAATTGLSLLFVIVTQLWSAGMPEWSFALAFMAVWVVLSVIWSNDDYIEDSNRVLARIVDHNFEELLERISELESQLQVDSPTTVEEADRAA